MYKPIFTGLAYGTLAYLMAKYGLFDNLIKDYSTQQNQTSIQKKLQECNLAKQQKDITNSFTNQAVTPITRLIDLNPKCKIIYSTLHKVPLCVHQFLDPETIQGEAKRARHFHIDTNIHPSKFAVRNDHYIKTGAYKNFHFTRGHMAAASDFSCSQELKDSTFSFANTIPQDGYNNGGIWNTFQRYSRSLLKDRKCDTLQIFSGPIYYNSNSKVQGFNQVYKNQHIVLLKNGIMVPPRLYKIIKCNINSKTYAAGFTFENSQTFDNSKILAQFQTQIEQIQNATGLTFNFKDQLTGKLSEHDPSLNKRDKYSLDKQFYGKLLQSADLIDDMNQALRRAYEQKISLEEQKQKMTTKIEMQGFKQFTNVKQNQQTSSCNKISNYLNLHKSLFYLGGENGRFEFLQKLLEEEIKNNIEPCHQKGTPQEHSDIAFKVGARNKKYSVPFKDLLKQAFPKGQRVFTNQPTETKSNENKQN